MDRTIQWTGELGRVEDFNGAEKNILYAVGNLIDAAIGPYTAPGTWVSGLAISAASPTPNLTVTIARGSIYTDAVVDATPYGDVLGTDANVVGKQGIVKTPTVLTITPPGTPGFSQVFVVEVAYSDVDGGAIVLPYENASNPLAPFAGPGNSGATNFTIRQGVCTVALKAGIAATTGTQATPAPDPGFIGLYAITVANGATQITAANWVIISGAPFIVPLTQISFPSLTLPADWVGSYGGTANALTGSLSPAPPSITAGYQVGGILTATNTGAATLTITGLGTAAIVTTAGSALAAGVLSSGSMMVVEFDGANWRLVNITPTTSIPPGTLLKTSVYTNVGGTRFISVNGGAPTTSGATTFSSGAGTNSITAEVQAGGGAGGSVSTSSGSQSSFGAGGSGGNYAMGIFTSGFTGGLTVTVGGGGAPGSAGNNPGNAGGSSSLGALITASGGAGGGGAATSSSAYWTVLAAPGAGGTTGGISGGNVLAVPGSSGGAGVVSTGAGCGSIWGLGGKGGDSFLGIGGGEVIGTSTITNGSGNPGTGYGSGSSGAQTSGTSGIAANAGQPGIVIVREFS